MVALQFTTQHLHFWAEAFEAAMVGAEWRDSIRVPSAHAVCPGPRRGHMMRHGAPLRNTSGSLGDCFWIILWSLWVQKPVVICFSFTTLMFGDTIPYGIATFSLMSCDSACLYSSTLNECHWCSTHILVQSFFFFFFEMRLSSNVSTFGGVTSIESKIPQWIIALSHHETQNVWREQVLSVNDSIHPSVHRATKWRHCHTIPC
jgi:hypothetical protein